MISVQVRKRCSDNLSYFAIVTSPRRRQPLPCARRLSSLSPPAQRVCANVAVANNRRRAFSCACVMYKSMFFGKSCRGECILSYYAIRSCLKIPNMLVSLCCCCCCCCGRFRGRFDDWFDVALSPYGGHKIQPRGGGMVNTLTLGAPLPTSKSVSCSSAAFRLYTK